MKKPPVSRLASIDRVRGAVMILMALDHVRDFIGPDVPFMAIDSGKTPTPLFLTRWITHFCAPVFVLLAGLSIGLMGVRKSPHEVRRFLLTRGLFLALLEVTLVRFGWAFDLSYHETYLGVLWAMGLSMILCAPLTSMKPKTALIVGLLGVLSHNLLDKIQADSLGLFGPVFSLLHEPHPYQPLSGRHVFVLYTIVPWVFVMLLGRGLAPLFELNPEARAMRFTKLYLASFALFFGLRVVLNAYGDPRPYNPAGALIPSVLDALDCRKYPPSLSYLLLTLGPAFLALGAAEKAKGRLWSWLETFGRVPLFYYVAHLFLAHAAALALYFAVYGTKSLEYAAHPELRARFSLPWVYGLTIGVVLVLTPACRWFATLKSKRKDLRFLAYL